MTGMRQTTIYVNLEHIHMSEENSGLHVQNQKLSEEASYAKELPSAAATELKFGWRSHQAFITECQAGKEN